MQCTSCKKQKKYSDFYHNRSNSRQCKECIREKTATYRKKMMKNPVWVEGQLTRLRLWKRKHKTELREKNRNWYYRVRLEVLQAYSGKIPKCACCKDSNIEFLAVDHIDGSGGKHRRELKAAGRGSNFFLWLKRNDFPKGFRILCHNCNFSIGRYGYCPHKLKTK